MIFWVLSLLVFVLLQAQKFAGVRDSLAEDFIHKIRRAKCPEEATRMGRTLARQRPDLVIIFLKASHHLTRLVPGHFNANGERCLSLIAGAKRLGSGKARCDGNSFESKVFNVLRSSRSAPLNW